MAYEQKKSTTPKSSSGMATIGIQKSGDEGIDAGMVALYEDLGYKHKSTSPTGTVVMEIPKEQAEARAQRAIDEHYKRTKAVDKPSLDGGGKVVSNTVERMAPVSAESLLSAVGVTEDDEPDLD